MTHEAETLLILENLYYQVVFEGQKKALKEAIDTLKGCKGCRYEETSPFRKPCNQCSRNRRDYWEEV